MTDADLILGRIPADAPLPGLSRLDVAAGRAALAAAGVSAEGIVAVVDASMEQAVRAVTVARGVDPAGLALVAFGGAGPLHAAAVAGALGMRAVIVPPRAGVLSAVGLLCSARQRDLVRSWAAPLDHAGLPEALAALGTEAVAAIGGGRGLGRTRVEVTTSVDCRYGGQSHELTVPSVADFGAEHHRRNGYERPDSPVEVVAIRARARTPAAMVPTDLDPPPSDRRTLRGPTVAAETDCTVWVPEGWTARVATDGSWVLTRNP